MNRAQKEGYVSIKYYNPRDFVKGSKPSKTLTYAERRVDDRPYGGGPGMVMEALPIIRAIEKAIGSKIKKSKSAVKIVFFSPSGKQFDNTIAETYKKYSDIVFVCGRYEGIDARIKKVFSMVDISVGPYVLTGGELPALIMIDSITRRIKGVLGHDSSIEESRISSPDVYTRPEIIEYKGKKYKVPKVLLSGHHEKINSWKIKRKV
jgi:tRNA (guanine37-N1)-methyltransferase